MVICVLKRLSGKNDNGRERFEIGASGSDGARVEMLDDDEKVGFERRLSGSAGARTAAEAIVAAGSAFNNMNFIITSEIGPQKHCNALPEDMSGALPVSDGGQPTHF